MYKVTISMPCWGRPIRTQRAIESIMYQDLQGWEALVVGDKCPHFQKLIDSGWLEERAKIASENGNSLVYYNNDPHSGHCGYKITNANIQSASGEYLLFMGNDDLLTQAHFSNYYSYIKEAGTDWMYFDSYLHPIRAKRIPKLAPSEIGHSEIIVKTELAKKAPAHTGHYGHDWDFICYLMKHGTFKKADSPHATYFVMTVPGLGSRDKID